MAVRDIRQGMKQTKNIRSMRRKILPPLVMAVSVVFSFFLERSGVRAVLGIGGAGFSFLAFAAGGVLFFIIIAPLAGLAGGTAFYPYDRRHTALIALTALFCIIISSSAYRNIKEPIEYPITNRTLLEGSSPYVQQFDAFRKGRLELDLPVSPELAGMENPYDTAMRNKNNVDYFWDRAFYNGRYYSYFGIAPLICVYYPFYALTGGLPSAVNVCLYLAVFTLAALAFAYREFLIYFGVRAHILLVIAGLVSLAFCSGIFAAQSYADVYYIPVLSAMGFNFSAMGLVLRARRTAGTAAASALLGGGALCFVLSVMSRPTAALMCITVLPALISRVISDKKGDGAMLSDNKSAAGETKQKARKREGAYRAARIAALLAPAALIAAAGAAVVMTLNFMRFGSVLDFGANYQLTVSDVSKNTVDPSLLPAALSHYLVQLPWRIESFPWVRPSYLVLEYGRKIYLDYNLGLLSFPSVAGLALAPAALCRERGGCERTFSLLCGSAAVFFVLFIDFCRAGVNMRYLYDFLPAAAALGTMMLLKISSAGGMPRRLIFAFVSILAFSGTILTALGVIMANGADKLFF